MKKLLYTFAVIASLVACSKDDEKPSFSKESTYGTWVESSDVDGDGIKDAVKIDATKYYTGADAGSGASFGTGEIYTYSDNTFTTEVWDDNDVKFVVADVNSTTLKLDGYLSGVKLDQTIYTKVQ